MTEHDNAGKWDALLPEVSRRDFILSSVAASVLMLTPRLVSAQAGRPYKIGPVVGSAIYTLLQTLVKMYTVYWPLTIGTVI